MKNRNTSASHHSQHNKQTTVYFEKHKRATDSRRVYRTDKMIIMPIKRATDTRRTIYIMYVHTALTSDNTNQSVQATLEVILTLDSKTTRGPASPEPRFSKSRLLTSSAPRLQSGHTATSQLGHRSARSGLKTFAQQRINHSLPHWRKDGQKRSCCGTCNNSVSENLDSGLVLFDPH